MLNNLKIWLLFLLLLILVQNSACTTSVHINKTSIFYSCFVSAAAGETASSHVSLTTSIMCPNVKQRLQGEMAADKYFGEIRSFVYYMCQCFTCRLVGSRRFGFIGCVNFSTEVRCWQSDKWKFMPSGPRCSLFSASQQAAWPQRPSEQERRWPVLHSDHVSALSPALMTDAFIRQSRQQHQSAECLDPAAH